MISTLSFSLFSKIILLALIEHLYKERGAAGDFQEYCGPKYLESLQPLLMPPPRQPFQGETYFLPGLEVCHRGCALLSDTNRQGGYYLKDVCHKEN